MQDLFADRLGNPMVAGGVSPQCMGRLKLVDLEKQQMVQKPSMRLVMPFDGLIAMASRLFAKMFVHGANPES